jgi:hypothetical protein
MSYSECGENNVQSDEMKTKKGKKKKKNHGLSKGDLHRAIAENPVSARSVWRRFLTR